MRIFSVNSKVLIGRTVFKQQDSLAQKSIKSGTPEERNNFYYYPDLLLTSQIQDLPEELKKVLELSGVQLNESDTADIAYSLYTNEDRTDIADHYTITLPTNHPTEFGVLRVARIPSTMQPTPDRILDTVLLQNKVTPQPGLQRETVRLFPQRFNDDPEEVANYLLQNPYHQLNILIGLANLYKKKFNSWPPNMDQGVIPEQQTAGVI